MLTAVALVVLPPFAGLSYILRDFKILKAVIVGTVFLITFNCIYQGSRTIQVQRISYLSLIDVLTPHGNY
jgi:hypothetical protein